jgi:hypothetical protein
VKKQDVLDLIDDQLRWYSEEIFSEPDFTKAVKVLDDNDISLSNIAADNFRWVLNVIKRRIIKELAE